jgi:DNA-binding transcriptional regulator YdaS (Cro superfamily)
MKLEKYLHGRCQAHLALDLGVDPSLVTHWLKGRKRITAERAVQIERATGGLVTREELRPDIFA